MRIALLLLSLAALASACAPARPADDPVPDAPAALEGDPPLGGYGPVI